MEVLKYFCVLFMRVIVGLAETNLFSYKPINTSFIKEPEHLDSQVSNVSFWPHSVRGWPVEPRPVYQIASVSFDREGHVVIFHRADRIWGTDTFAMNNTYLERYRGPITINPVEYLSPETGAIVRSWGAERFYLPHGLTVDHKDNVWLTDVALHQVFRFSSDGKLLLTLGKPFEQGNDKDRFCKPTSVAVMSDGQFFVADGYCNSRILKYGADGTRLLEWGRNSIQPGNLINPYALFVPHALALVESKNALYVADRENGRVQCFDTRNGTFLNSYHHPTIGSRIFSVAVQDTKLFLVNGADFYMNRKAQGFVYDMDQNLVASVFAPSDGKDEFGEPHDLAVSNDGAELYVVQLDYPHIYKFAFSTNTSNIENALLTHDTNIGNWDSSSISRLVIGFSLIGIVLIALLTFLVTLCSKVSKQGGSIFGKRRQSFEFKPTVDDGFKLSNFLERGKHTGFEKVNTEESDEEANAKLAQYA